MKKTDKTALTAAVFAAALNAVPMAATAYDPADEPIQDVYGPPAYFETTTETSSSTTTTMFEALYGPPWVMYSIYPELTATSTTTTEPVPQPAYGPPPIAGDVDGDGVIDTFDLVRMRQLYNNNNNYLEYAPMNSDVNNDSVFSIADLVVLSKYLLGQIDGLGWRYTEPKTEQPTTTVTEQNEDPVSTLTTQYTTVYGPPSVFEGKDD